MYTFALMLKKYLFISLFVLITGFAGAQKVDLDPYHFNFEYRDIPHTVFDSTLKSYEITVDLSGKMEQYMTADVISSKVILQGFDKVETDGDVDLLVSFGDFIVEGYKIIEDVSESKNKDGTVKKTYTYTISLDYSLTGSATVHDKQGGELVKSINLISSRTYNWKSNTYSSRRDAESYYYSNKSSIVSKLARERLNEAINTANAYYNRNIGFPSTTENLFLWLIDNKKHPEYSAMNARWTALKPVLEGATANTLSGDDRSKINEMIKYFDGLKTTYAKDEKGDKKIRYASYYNNALLYMLLDEPEKAVKEAQGLITNDYDTKDGVNLKEKAENLIEQFRKNNLYTRHFSASGVKPYGKR